MVSSYQQPNQPFNEITVTQEGQEATVTVVLPKLTEKDINNMAQHLRRLSKLAHTHISPLISHTYSKKSSCLSLRYFVGDAVQLSQIMTRSAEKNSAKPQITETTIVGLLLHATAALGFICNPIRSQLMNVPPQHHSFLSPDFIFINEHTRMASILAVGIYWNILQPEGSRDTTPTTSYNREKEDVLMLGRLIDNIITQSAGPYSGLLKRIVNLMLNESPQSRPNFAELSIFLSSLVELQQTPQYKSKRCVASADELQPPRTMRRASTQIPDYQRSPSPTYERYASTTYRSTEVPKASHCIQSPTEHFSYTAPIRRPISVLQQVMKTKGQPGTMHPIFPQPFLKSQTNPGSPFSKDMKLSRKCNLLFEAVESNDISEVRRLKELFARGTDASGNTALIRALQLRNTDIAMELLPLEYQKRNSKGQLPLMVSLIEKMDAVAVELLLNYDEFYGTTDDKGNTALIYAVASHFKKAVEVLAAHEHNISNKEGKYPIHIAIENGFVDLALYLLEYNSNVLDKEYKTLSEYCDLHNCPLVKDRLLTITKQESSIPSDYTALMVAAGLNDIDDLYKYLPLHVGMRHVSGETALMIAIRKSQVDAIRVLLPYEFHLPDKAGHFFMYQAGSTGSRQVIKCALDSLFTDTMLMCLQFDDNLSEIAVELRVMIEDALTSNDQDLLRSCIQDLDSIIGHQVETGAIATYYDDLWVGPSTPLLLPESAIHLGETDLDIHALDVSNIRAYAEASTSSQINEQVITSSRLSKPLCVSNALKDSKSVTSSKLSRLGHRSSSSLALQATAQVNGASKSIGKVSAATSGDSHDHSLSTELSAERKKAKTLLTASTVGFKELSESLQSSSATLFSTDINEYGNTPLTCSVLNSDVSSVKSFAKRYACSLNNKGETALHTALQLPNNSATVEMVRILAPLEWNVSSSNGTYPIELAAIRMLREAFLILVDHDSRYSTELVRAIKKAIDEGDAETVKSLVWSKRI
ncbi:Protein 21.1 [Giardia lamblia P15]|uniref:Protein 21.1 n=1 Tax=Giardia intestinalis (strain P15) TaxID=658858 RepID=E1F1X5_GIAIA|nr:Protein 21.1 [Giardia lamblia P15]